MCATETPVAARAAGPMRARTSKAATQAAPASSARRRSAARDGRMTMATAETTAPSADTQAGATVDDHTEVVCIGFRLV